jgi:hypothetical protein
MPVMPNNTVCPDLGEGEERGGGVARVQCFTCILQDPF